MLIKNIKGLCGIRKTSLFLRGQEMAVLPTLENAYLKTEGDSIVAFGEMKDLGAGSKKDQEIIDARGRYVLPAWCDAHTHLVFAGSREGEFVDKIKGRSYEEIYESGGGILNSVRLISETSEEALFAQTWERLKEVRSLGTGAIEIKSGYGLSLEGELKMLRVIRRLKDVSGMPIKATFLGAHAIPAAYENKRQDYLDLLCEEMLPKVVEEELADYVDVFCEKGFFTLQETQKVLDAARKVGLKAKLHANQLNYSGGVQLGVRNRVLSVDHLEHVGQEEIAALRNSSTLPVLLPTAAFFLRMPFPPARKMIDAGLGVALATDFNPGSSPSGNIPFLIALACIQLRMTPEEAINAVTINAACAMELEHELGSIAIGKKANLVLTKPMPSLAYLPYAFGSNMVGQVMIGGKMV